MNLRDPYTLLVVLRFALTLIPQASYLHPDEFFESYEIVAGKILDLKSSPAEGLNSTSSIKSIFLPCALTGLSEKFLFNLIPLFQISSVTPYLFLVFPRITMCSLSLLVDYNFKRICRQFNTDIESRLIILASSFVFITYGTRTFTETIELIIFSFLLYHICESIMFNNLEMRALRRRATAVTDARTFEELYSSLFLKLDYYLNIGRNSSIIMVACVFGIFNQFTFISYALGPIAMWLYRGFESRFITNCSRFNRRVINVVNATMTAVLLLLIESASFKYFNVQNYSIVERLSMDFPSLFNFTQRIQIFKGFAVACLNMLWMFNVLPFLGIMQAYKIVTSYIHGEYRLTSKIISIRVLMETSIIVSFLTFGVTVNDPKCFLSALLPLIYLYAPYIVCDIRLLYLKRAPVRKMWKTLRGMKAFKIWIFTNLIFTIFYAFVYQGGLFRAANYLSTELAEGQVDSHIVTSNVYALPQSLLVQPAGDKNYEVFIHNKDRNPLSQIVETLKTIVDDCDDCSVYLILPGLLHYDFVQEIANENFPININSATSFFPHAQPKLMFSNGYWGDINYNQTVTGLLTEILEEVHLYFSLQVYEISLNKKEFILETKIIRS